MTSSRTQVAILGYKIAHLLDRYKIAHLLHICVFSGLPTSPLVDVGQIEGGLVMALGMWTSEQVQHPPKTHPNPRFGMTPPMANCWTTQPGTTRCPLQWTFRQTFDWSCTTVGRTRGWCWGARQLVRHHKTKQGKVAHKFHPGEASVLGGVSVLMALR